MRIHGAVDAWTSELCAYINSNEEETYRNEAETETETKTGDTMTVATQHGSGIGVVEGNANLNNWSLYNCPTRVDQQQFNRVHTVWQLDPLSVCADSNSLAEIIFLLLFFSSMFEWHFKKQNYEIERFTHFFFAVSDSNFKRMISV